MTSRILNTVGLLSAIVGCVLLYCFGLPPSVDPSGAVHLILEQTNSADVAKGARYLFLGRVGIGLVGLGSLLQLIAAWIPATE
jgi:hypothetical protein